MKELEQEVIAWHKSRFPDTTEQEQFEKLVEELDEYQAEAMRGPWTQDDNYTDEMADLIITHMVHYGRYHGESLSEVVRRKFERVRERYGA